MEFIHTPRSVFFMYAKLVDIHFAPTSRRSLIQLNYSVMGINAVYMETGSFLHLKIIGASIVLLIVNISNLKITSALLK